MAAERRANLAVMRWMILGEWRSHPGRVLVATFAIAIGVALGFAVHLINASALNEFAQAVRTINGDADLRVHAVSGLGFDENLYPQLARLPGIAAASPVVEVNAVVGGGPPLTVLGLDPLRALAVSPTLIGHRIDGAITAESIFDPDAIFLSQAALSQSHKKAGDRLALTAGGQTVEFVIAGTLPGVAPDERLAVLDIAAAQWRFGHLGHLSRVDLKVAQGTDTARMSRAIAAMLPASAELVDAESEARRSDSLSRAYRVNLDMLALMALISGAFLVYSAQALSVTRRRNGASDISAISAASI